MAKICVISPTISFESAKELADRMGWDYVNPFKAGLRNFNQYDGVFNYGCNREIYARNVLNTTKSVATCINKVATFKAFKEAGIPTVEYTTKQWEVPKAWETVVMRKKVDGHKAQGLDYYYTRDDQRHFNPVQVLPIAALYTEYFDHVKELRIVVFCGKVVGAYRKRDDNGTWHFISTRITDKLTEHAISAAKALGINYVGFDVLVNKKGVYVFLEANSGPVLTDETVDAIKAFFP